MLMMTGGDALVEKTLRTFDRAIDRAFDLIDMEDYRPLTTS